MIQRQSTIRCLQCGGTTEETMPTNACVIRYTCKHCAAVLTPKAGDCCVFCSFGTVACPPIQDEQ